VRRRGICLYFWRRQRVSVRVHNKKKEERGMKRKKKEEKQRKGKEKRPP